MDTSVNTQCVVDPTIIQVVTEFNGFTSDTDKLSKKQEAVTYITKLKVNGTCTKPKLTNMNYWNSNINPNPVTDVYKISKSEIGIKSPSTSSIVPNQTQNPLVTQPNIDKPVSAPVVIQKPSTFSCDAPSKHFCDTGILKPGETYNQDIHNYGKTPVERCHRFYDDYKKFTFHYIYNRDVLGIYDAIRAQNMNKLKLIMNPFETTYSADANKGYKLVIPAIYLLHSIHPIPLQIIKGDTKYTYLVYFTPFQYACYNHFYSGCALILSYIIAAGKEEFIRQLCVKTFIADEVAGKIKYNLNETLPTSDAAVTKDEVKPVLGMRATYLLANGQTDVARTVLSKATQGTKDTLGSLATFNIGNAVGNVTSTSLKIGSANVISNLIALYKDSFQITNTNINIKYDLYPNDINGEYIPRRDYKYKSPALDLPNFENSSNTKTPLYIDTRTKLEFALLPKTPLPVKSMKSRFGFGGKRKTRKSNKSNKRRTRSMR
jgi:hypothetical protein